MYPKFYVLLSFISIHESEISLRFALWPAVFEIQAMLKMCTKLPSNDLEPYKVKCTTYMCVTSIHESQISLRFTLWAAIFWDTGNFETSALTPKWHWILQSQGYFMYD